MIAPDWYDAWCEEAFAVFTAKQQQIAETYRLDSWVRYDYDAAAGVITFTDGMKPRVTAEIQVLGTTGESEFLWSWANAELPATAVEGAARVKAFGAESGIEELTTERLKGDDLTGLGWMLAAIATRVLDAEGAYRAPTATGAVFLVLRSLKFVS
ncbi:MAG: hypothetical protein KKE02_13200 [Alphaproteobacteria bacterium]|nr:hypothetical protein [Alphaproteobacteria bacterium]MBU1513294.1 hypothetical protein [Alphaproteobacteria bacterium]MBU2093586.1 hypothetical protein [Alphaproteobacteria bacterium]MBU2151970.1 hypothetical protein [Alphaproteobacteria bacterium]MBU2307630.1 hypothetical protein [Alphaproteobacteria bacterium]